MIIATSNAVFIRDSSLNFSVHVLYQDLQAWLAVVDSFALTLQVVFG